MVMVEYFANSPTCALGDFACALGGADTDVLASDGSAFGDIASGVEWVECDKVARTFPDTAPLAVPLPMSPAPLPTSPPGLPCWGCCSVEGCDVSVCCGGGWVWLL
jgi:hypothetical protein